MAVFGVVLSLLLLVVMVYRGVSILVVSPLMAMLAVWFSGDMPVITAWTGPLMTATGDFIRAYFPVFLVGAIFGALMSATGAAREIALWISAKMGAKNAMLAVILASFLLVYGGVSVFVVVFAILPIAENIFQANDFPRRLIPGAIISGAMPAYAAPGAAQFINTIPIPLFGTTIYSGMVGGTIATVLWILLCVFYMNRQVARARQSGEGYGETGGRVRAGEERAPSVFCAFLPLVCVVSGNAVLTLWFGSGHLQEYFEPHGGIEGIWPITISLSLTIVLMIVLFRRYLRAPIAEISRGAADSLLPIFNTAIQVGYGGVIKKLAVFGTIKFALLALPGPKLAVIGGATAVIAGIVGSASGGTGIAVQAFGQDFLEIARQHNLSLDVMHRVMMFGANILGTLPHSGFVITLLGVCGLSHRQSYKDIFVASVIFPFVSALALVMLAAGGIE